MDNKQTSTKFVHRLLSAEQYAGFIA